MNKKKEHPELTNPDPGIPRPKPKPRIMIVEDEGVTAAGIQDSLEEMGYEVMSSATSGEEAVKIAAEDHPDLILMDINLGGNMDGIETAGRIRSVMDVPVIYLTAHSDEHIFQRAKITDPFGYIVKPFDDRELRIGIEMALYKHRTEAELKRYRDELMDLVDERTAELENRNNQMALEILERKQTEAHLKTTTDLLMLFPHSYSRKEYLDAVVKIIQSWTCCCSVGIRVLNESGEVPYESHTGYPDKFWESENSLSIGRDHCICLRVFTNNFDPQDMPAVTPAGSFFCNNTFSFITNMYPAEKARYRGICVHEGYASVSIIPVRFMGRTIAAIHIAERREGMVPIRMVQSIESMTPLIGEALHRFQMEEELADNYRSLQESNELLESIFSNIHVLIAYMDRDFNFIRVNTKYAEADEHEPAYYEGKNHFDLFPNEENLNIFRKVVETGEPHFARAKPFSYAHNPERGTSFWDWSLKPVTDREGRVSGLVLSLIDVTDNITLYGELMRADHLASIGRLAAGVAHEVNNPINGIINYAQILTNRTQAGSKEHDIAERIIRESDRIAGIVRSLLSFARENKGEKSAVIVREILSDALSLLDAQLRKDNIRLDLNVPGDLLISANPQQIEQVFLNMLSNARQALNEKYPGDSDGKTISVYGEKISLDDAPYVRLVFGDNGAGIPEEIISKLMVPFFSTKPEGTGLGLSISHGIVMDHKGRISIESREGEFTRVIIDLPAA
ncbi:MAG: response regulator [Nitrospirota bacterium]